MTNPKSGIQKNPALWKATWLASMVFLYLFCLGNHGLFEDNEGRYAEASWEMAHSGDYLTPRLNFIKYLDKPPLAYWLTAASVRLLGDSEGAARLPTALAALASVLLVAWLGQQMWGLRAGLASGAVLATSTAFWLMGRIVLTDMFLALSVTAALACAWMILNGRPGCWYLGFWSALAAGMLSKGPVALLIVFLTVGCTMLWAKEWNWRPFRPLSGLLLFLLLTAPWFVAICVINPEALEYFLVFQTVDRVGTTVHGRTGPIWFYVPALLIGFFPWSTLLPAAFARGLKQSTLATRFLVCWFVPSFVFFSLAGSKLPTYLAPLFPAVALLVGAMWASGEKLRAPALAGVAGLALFGIGAAVFLSGRLPPEIVAARSLLLVVAGIALVGTTVAGIAWGLGKPDATLTTLAVTYGLVLLTLGLCLSRVDEFYTAKEIARAVKAQHPDRVATYASHLRGLPFYLNRRIVNISFPRETRFDSPEHLAGYYYRELPDFLAELNNDQKTVLIVRHSDYHPDQLPGWDSLGQVGKYILLVEHRYAGESER